MGEWEKRLKRELAACCKCTSFLISHSSVSHSPILLLRAKISSFPGDDLIVLNQANRQLHILTTGAPQRTNNKEQITNNAVVSLDTASAPVAVLPMRLNSDGLSDLVILQEGQTAPTVALTAPLATFTVTNTNNGGAGSLRQAIIDANNSPGADMISFKIGGGASKRSALIRPLMSLRQ